MSFLDDRRNTNRCAMVAIAFLVLSFAVESLPNAGPLPFLLTLGAILSSLLAITISWRVNRQAAQDAAPEGPLAPNTPLGDGTPGSPRPALPKSQPRRG